MNRKILSNIDNKKRLERIMTAKRLSSDVAGEQSVGASTQACKKLSCRRDATFVIPRIWESFLSSPTAAAAGEGGEGRDSKRDSGRDSGRESAKPKFLLPELSCRRQMVSSSRRQESFSLRDSSSFNNFGSIPSPRKQVTYKYSPAGGHLQPRYVAARAPVSPSSAHACHR